MYLTSAKLMNIQESELEQSNRRFIGSSNRSQPKCNRELDSLGDSKIDLQEVSEYCGETNLQEYRKCERQRVLIHIIEEGIRLSEMSGMQSVIGPKPSRSGTLSSHSTNNKSMVQTGEDLLYPASFHVEWNRLPMPLVMETHTQEPSSAHNHFLQPTHSLNRTDSAQVDRQNYWIEESPSVSFQLLPKASSSSDSKYLVDTEENENQSSVQERFTNYRPVNLVPLRSKIVNSSKVEHC